MGPHRLCGFQFGPPQEQVSTTTTPSLGLAWIVSFSTVDIAFRCDCHSGHLQNGDTAVHSPNYLRNVQRRSHKPHVLQLQESWGRRASSTSGVTVECFSRHCRHGSRIVIRIPSVCPSSGPAIIYSCHPHGSRNELRIITVHSAPRPIQQLSPFSEPACEKNGLNYCWWMD